jgi:signal transduction histidine kinase
VKWLLTSAALLAIGLIVAGVVTGKTLEARGEAVRDGVLNRSVHAIERELRERGPAEAAGLLRQRVEEDPAVAALELRRGDVVVARAGEPSSSPALEFPLFPGPGWRTAGGGSQYGARRGQSPFVLLLWPDEGIGDSSTVAAIATWGSIVVALALLGFAAAAARGIEARQRALTLDAERRRLEVVTAAGAGLAHRIRNPLATIKATAQMAGEQCEGTMKERAARIVDASVRIELLVDELLAFARPVEIHPEDFDLVEAARSVCERVAAGGPVRVRADREHVISAIEELVSNARFLGDAQPEVVVSRRGRSATVEVLDRGPGLQIDPERAFEPYVTTRANGTGLGLAVIRGLVRANGGEVTLADRAGGGCIATLEIPAVTS